MAEALTIQEMRQKVAEADCDMFGHSFDVVAHMPSGRPTRVFCSRCGMNWSVSGPGIRNKGNG